MLDLGPVFIKVGADTKHPPGHNAGSVHYCFGKSSGKRIGTIAVGAANLPFGDTKRSGYGRGLSELGIDESVNKKLIRLSKLN